MPSESSLNAYYQQYWQSNVATSTPSTRRYYLAQAISRIRYLQKQISFAADIKILDVGAGPGLFLQALIHEGLNAKYYAIEPDKIEGGKLGRDKRVSAVYRSVDECPTTTKFDLIVLSHVLEHVTFPNEFIAALMDRLASNGILFIEVPNNDHLYKQQFEPHVLFFNRASLNQLLNRHGKVLNISNVGLVSSSSAAEVKIVSRSHINIWVREMIKTLLYWLGVTSLEKIILRYNLSSYGDERQWLRAVVVKR
jgi:2-polyprenyl-3-methyl-5-hydroxy-6-metoxy-1,4-benzoquinol methylase